MKKTAALVLSAMLTVGAFSGLASAADDLTAQQKFEALKAKGIFSGLGDGSAGLDQNMNRAQFARVAALILGLDGIGSTDTKVVTEKPFSDVELGAWYIEEIAAVKEAGLFIGNGDGAFNPNGNVTIEQQAKIVTKLLDIPVDNSAAVDGASNWAQGYVAAALKAGLIANTGDFSTFAKREQLVVSAFATDVLQTEIKTVTEENKKSIGKLLALGTLSADGDQFGSKKPLTKDDLLKALDSMTNGKFDASGLQLSASPTFAEVLRAYLQVLGYPADALKDSDKLIDMAIESGIVSKDSPLLKIQQLNVPLNREWGSYLTAGALFNATTVTVDSNGNVKQNTDKHLSETMKLPDTPIKVQLSDVQDVPTYDTLKSIDPIFEKRATPAVTSSGANTPVPNTPGDTTAPYITAATIILAGSPSTSETVSITGGNSGEILLNENDRLIGGTISVSEASTLTITAIEGIDLTSLSSLLTQSLPAGSKNLDIITLLDDVLDPQNDGISASLLGARDSYPYDGLVITGTLRDSAGNQQTVTLTIKVRMT